MDFEENILFSPLIQKSEKRKAYIKVPTMLFFINIKTIFSLRGVKIFDKNVPTLTL